MFGLWGDKYLNSMVAETPAEELEKIGFTKNMLEKYEHSNSQKRALLKLVTNEKLLPEQALEEIDKLTYYMCEAIVEFYSKGLRGDDLRKWISPPNSSKKFSDEHLSTLRYIIEKQKIFPSDAIKKLNCLNEIEALAYQFEQLSLPSSIVSLNKIMFAKTFREYRSSNLKIEHFNEWSPDCTIQFTDSHKELCGKMLVLLHIKPQKAINLISSQKITDAQAKELIKFLDPNTTREYAFATFERISKMEELKLTSEQMKTILFEEKSFVTYPSISQF